MEQEQKYNFKWWARCKLNGMTCSFSGTTPAKDAREASDNVETVQRGKLIKGKSSVPA